MPRLPVDDLELYYELEGDQPRPLLVLHGGLGVDHVPYRRTLAPLTERFKLVLFDQRGNGRSVPADLSKLSMPRLADDAIGLVDGLGLERVTVFGHSYGGFVAQELALRHPDRVEGLILVGTTPGQLGAGEEAEVDQGPPPPSQLSERMAVFPTTDTEVAELMLDLLPFYFPDFEDMARLHNAFEGVTYRADAMARGFEVLAGWSSVDRLRSIEAPTLLLAGALDLFTSYPQSYRIARHLPDAQVVVVPDSGHFPWIDQPGVFFGAVHDWADKKLGR